MHPIEKTQPSEKTMNFDELALPQSLATALQAIEFKTLTPIQQATIPIALKGQDVLGCAKTGTGKTGAFGIPLVNYLTFEKGKMALVLAPTRELAEQIFTFLKTISGRSNFHGTLVVGGASIHNQIASLRKGARFIVATPGRLLDLMKQNQVKLAHTGMLVLDEFDRMLDMGFAPQLKQIMRTMPSQRQTLLFSATYPQEILKLAESYLHLPFRISIAETSEQRTIEQKFLNLTEDEKRETLFKEVAACKGKILVFTRTKRRTDRIAKMLLSTGERIECLHGDRSPPQRRRALDFFRDGSSRILVATDIAGRGIDVDDIERVINFDMPATAEDYVHRIGRTGRNGKQGVALSFLTSADRDVVRALKLDIQLKNDGLTTDNSQPSKPQQRGRGRR